MPNNANPMANTTTALTAVQKAQLLLALDALVQDRHNLTVHLPHDHLQTPVVDWFGALLADRWPQAQVQICQRLDGHRLIEAFNESLIPLPAGSDGVPPPSTRAMQVWLVPEESFQQPSDLDLVVRLLQRFPNAPIRAVLLLGPYTALAEHKGPMGARFETFHLDERQPSPAHDDAPAHLSSDPASLAAGLTATYEPTSAQGSAHAPAYGSDPVTPAAAVLPDLDNVVPGNEFETTGGSSSTGAGNYLLPAAALAATVLIGGLFWWSQRSGSDAAGGKEVSGSLTMPVPTPVPAPASAAAASVAGAIVVPASPPQALPAPAARAASAAAPQASAPSTPASAPSVSTQDWLASLPDNALVVEHGRYDTMAEARRFIGSRNYLNEARILAVKEGKGEEYLVVTGPFRTADRASNYMRRLNIKATTQPVEQIRNQIAP
jgi:hypothetical protein